MNIMKKSLAGFFALCISTASIPFSAGTAGGEISSSAATDNIESQMNWGTLKIGGAGFVSGIVAGQKEMYLRTDVGGAYKWDYEKSQWVQLFGFLTDADRGLLSVKGIAIDPTDDNTAYFLCGCAYFSDARTVIFKTTDGGKTFTESDVTKLIQVHGNGDGRECIEPIAIDPDAPNTIYAGGDVTAGASALIKSTDGGKTWDPVIGYDDLGLFPGELKYPMWTENMARGTEPAKEYNQQNGIGCILIENGKVYVGTSVTGKTNIHVADVKDDKFTELSADLPTANYPCAFSSDKQGNIFFTYIAGLAFAGTAGGAYKYDTKTGKVSKLNFANEMTKSDYTGNAFGKVFVDPSNPKKLVARTCGVWSDQWYSEIWTDDSIAWGDHFFRSTDGGETWQDITPGIGKTIYGDGDSYKVFTSLPMDTNGYDWIYGKACHWGSGIIIDPRNSDRILMTSGNGVFACDNTWDEKDIQFYFQPDGVEEVVALDFVSVPGGANYSAIGDYDGFIHESVTGTPQQYKPNIGSTSAIAYCPSDTKVMARVGEHEAKGYYSLDAGKTWNTLKVPNGGGKLAITQLDDGTYRFIKASSDNAAIQYTDDFGATWKDSTGLEGSKTTYPLVDLNNPAVVYGSGIKYNSYWASDTTKKEPTLDDAQYDFYISTDYGATFTKTIVCMYDQCDHSGDLAYITDDTVAMAVGWNGLYIISDEGKKAEKLENVFYCKTVGYGAPQKAGQSNTLYIYGKPAETDPEGIYRSTDEGKTWVCINKEHIYGGTGNGNFLVGDMNEFGKVYMSTVGCGIVYGELSDGTDKPPVTTTTKTPVVTTTTSATTKPTSSTEDGVIYGDANNNGKVEIADAVLIMQAVANKDEYGLGGKNTYAITPAGYKNADCYDPGSDLTSMDALAVQKKLVNLVELPEYSK